MSKLLNRKGSGTQPSPPDCSKRLLKIIALAYIYQLTKFGDFMSFGLKDIIKNTHHDVTDFVDLAMVKNTKT